VQLERRESGLAVITLGGSAERVVSLTFSRLSSFRVALESLKSQKPKGLVITGPSLEMFTVGADIGAIRNVTDPKEGARLAREGQQIFGLIEQLGVPTVAAISGPCMGGGCELSLACSVRLISDHRSSQIGLPEVKLGILPGFGGTQRLPRLIGLPKALDIILAGRSLRAEEAKRVGLVNEIVPSAQLLARAESIALGKSSAEPVRRSLKDLLLTHTSLGRHLVRKGASAMIRKQTKGHYPAPPRALEVTLHGLKHGLTAGFEREAEELGKLIVTPESKNLVRVFGLTEASKGIGRSAREEAQNLHALVIGAGVMGAGIAASIARQEAPVILRDSNEGALSSAVGRIREYFRKQRGLTDAERSFMLNRIETSTKETPSSTNVSLVIEAIVEDLAVKQQLLGEVARQVPETAIIASNTSSLSITELASSLPNPERVIGMHFFNPVEKMPLLEIVRGKKTSVKSIAVVAAVATRLGKYPIVVEDVPGFLVNRILAPYLNEAARLLAEGYSIADIDKAATQFGMPMGPIRLLDEVGLDVAAHVAQIMVRGYGARMEGPNFAAQLLAKDRKGKKSGAGFYDHPVGEKERPAENIRELLGITAPAQSAPDLGVIHQRLIMALLLEAITCLDEAVAGNPGPDAADQIDLGTIMGIGFPPFRGGLLAYADTLGPLTIKSILTKLEKEVGPRFSPPPGIARRIQAGTKFREALASPS
jgi:3-hydroxyacyl-CoA dehydrogenase/enoyl-CoA hydratase/3-hydroxybutyryl-CoA epimerase